MYKKSLVLVILVISITLAFAGTGYCFGEVNKAKEFIRVQMIPQAIALLEKRIQEAPLDQEAHFQLAICYIHKGGKYYTKADERFASAVSLEASMGYKIAEIWQRIGFMKLGKGDMQEAKYSFEKAIEYSPSTRVNISNELFTLGEQKLNQGFVKKADGYISLACVFNPLLQEKSSDLFFNAGTNQTENNCLEYYYISSKYSQKNNQKIGERLLLFSRKQTTEIEIQFFRTAAANFIEVPPDFKIYQPGIYHFVLKANERTDHWIHLPHNLKVSYDVHSSDDMFKLQFKDGQIVEAWTPGSWPNKHPAIFKIIAVKNQSDIKMKISKQ